jgi:hypothetical protein
MYKIMGRIIISVSITSEMNQFLMENKDISPTRIIQDHLLGLMSTKLNPVFLKEMQEEKQRIEDARDRWKDMFYKAQEFLSKEGLNDKFNETL